MATGEVLTLLLLLLSLRDVTEMLTFYSNKYVITVRIQRTLFEYSTFSLVINYGKA